MKPSLLKGRTLLITSGPTRERLDPIRFLTNASSGRLGACLAREAKRLGARVVLVTGPVSEPPPAGCSVVRVETALEMRREVLKRSRSVDAVIAAAAVGDWRFAGARKHKLKRSPGRLRLTLIPNPDIVKEAAARRRPGQVFAGFALETRRAMAEARRKLRSKGLDFIALNGPESLGASRADLTLVCRDAPPARLGPRSKPAAARAVILEVARRLG